MARKSGRLALAGVSAAVAGAAWYGSRYSPRDLRTRTWYARLDKPRFQPPAAVYPVVWTALYSLVALSGYRIWRSEPSPERSRALRLWITQLAANAKWTKLFFGKHRPDLSLADALALEGLLLSYINTARTVDRGAAVAFVPYAAWVAFAAYLNEEIARLNPDAEFKLPRAS
jgi:tryptophan-rich sensory protein